MRLALALLLLVLSACGESSKPGEVDEALAQLRSAAPAKRHEAVVRLGMLPTSEARLDGLATAVRDSDDSVRLMAAIVIVGDALTELPASLRPPAPPTPNPSPTPNPPQRAHLSPTEALVYLDPWFAGTLLPGALKASQSRDERVRTLGERALKELKREQGVRVVSWHLEHVSGGADPSKRDGFQAALASVITHRAGRLVLPERTRLARDVDLVGHLRYLVRQAGAEVCTTDATGSRLEGRIKDVLGEQEREEIRRRTREALARKRERGERIKTRTDDGASVATVKRIETTMRYAHAGPESGRRAIDGLAAALTTKTTPTTGAKTLG